MLEQKILRILKSFFIVSLVLASTVFTACDEDDDSEIKIGELSDTNIIMLLRTIKLFADNPKKIDTCLDYVKWLFEYKKTIKKN